MKDKEFNAKIEERLTETDDWDEYYKQEDYDYNHERGEDNCDDEEEN